MTTYVFDACALIAFLADEEGAECVDELLNQASENECTILMHKINLLEVYYGIYREEPLDKANEVIHFVQQLPIHIISELSNNVFEIAGKIKATYRVSLADSIFVAQGMEKQGLLVTSDHHEFDLLEQKENIKFMWVR